MNSYRRVAGRRGRVLLSIASLLVFVPAAWSQNSEIEAVYTLPEIPLAEFLRSGLGISVEDHQLKLGSVGSDLFHVPGDAPDIFWMLTDRGPNSETPVGSETRMTFPVPEYTPFLLRVKLKDGSIQIQQALPITGDGAMERGVTGLANSSRDGKAYDCSGHNPLPFHPDGLDTEGMVRMRDGSFWLGDEYGPSIVHVGPNGRVIQRFLPAKLIPPTVTSGYPSEGALPEIFGMRKKNRGFEGIAVSPDESMLYLVLQSPLLNPDKAVGEASRNTRILGFDPRQGVVVSEYIYRLQPAAEFEESNPAEMKVSALAMLDEHRLLALERTDKVARLYRIELSGATNIYGSRWDRSETLPAMEALDEAELSHNGLHPLSKQLVAELDSAKGFPEKIEGLALLDERTIAVANDNDFAIAGFTMSGNTCTAVDSGVKSRILILKLDQPLRETSGERSAR